MRALLLAAVLAFACADETPVEQVDRRDCPGFPDSPDTIDAPVSELRTKYNASEVMEFSPDGAKIVALIFASCDDYRLNFYKLEGTQWKRFAAEHNILGIDRPTRDATNPLIVRTRHRDPPMDMYLVVSATDVELKDDAPGEWIQIKPARE